MNQPIDNNLYIRVFRAGSVVIEPSWWHFRYPSNLFWRLYYNDREGAHLTVPDGTISQEGGHPYIIPAHLPLHLRCTHAIQHFYVHFDITGMPDIALREMFHVPFTLAHTSAWESLIREAAHGLAPQWRDQDQPLGIAAQCRIKAILHEALAQYLETIPAEQIARCWYLARRMEPVQPAVAYVETHQAEDLSNPILARECSMSEGHFIRTFSACMEQTPAQYIIERRIKTAMRRLLLTSESIDRISEECGFGSRHYFSRMFARQTGQSPAAFRRGLSGRPREAGPGTSPPC